MKLTCEIVEDLLPLYLDDSCSADSRSAIEEHLKECSSCREKFQRMQKNDFSWNHQIDTHEIQVKNYAKKIRMHRIRVAISTVLITIITATLLSLCLLTIRDMHAQMNPIVPAIEEDTFNLVASSIETTAENLDQYVFYTNYSQISISVKMDADFDGSVMLYDAADDENYLMISDIDSKHSNCQFTNLSATRRYTIKCVGLNGATITVSEVRSPNFWKSLKNVLYDVVGN